MNERYHNENDIPLFGEYTDPYADRKIQGPSRPAGPLDSAEMTCHRSFEEGKVYCAWLGHSSVFLHMHGKNILIDPVFAKYASPVPLTVKRFPGKTPEAKDLPVIDALLLTHNHYDHMDKHTIRMLDSQVKHYIVPEKTGDLLVKWGIDRSRITELGWYEETDRDGLKISLVPSQHQTARTLKDRSMTLWGGYILQDEDFTVFDSGDGGFAEHFKEIRRRYGKPDLAIMECGQYNCRWHGLHMFPEESAEASFILEAKVSIPVHWGAYVLSNHAWNEPCIRFIRRAQELGVPYRIPRIHEWIELTKSADA